MKKSNHKDTIERELTAEELEFCELFVYGGSELAGQQVKCYMEVFGSEKKNLALHSRRLLAKPHVAAKIKELVAAMEAETETIAVKLQVSETLKSVMEETSTITFMDKFGVPLSPAPLRAVSVNAAKALMDIYPIKASQEAKFKVDGNGGGITFNVIVPNTENKDEK